MKDLILILDFGSQYTHLIKTNLEKLSIYSKVEPADFSQKDYRKKYADYCLRGIILSGGSQSVNNNNINFKKEWLSLGIPILGICYGHQLLAKLFGGEVKTSQKEFGKETLNINTKYRSKLFDDVREKSVVWMSHKDSVTHLPKDFVAIGLTKNSLNAAIENSFKKIYCIQFHPEVSHTEEGLKILLNFCEKICAVKKVATWTPLSWIKEASKFYQKHLGKEKIIIAISGGVDSMTMTTLLRKFFPEKQLLAVYFDTGLMPDITQSEVKKLCKDINVNLLTKDLSAVFFKNLKGITDPSKKGKIIGNTFIKEFEKIAEAGHIKFFAQGTIWSDVIESGITKFSSQIKPHHNVSGLPAKMNFELVEPFRELFKDQVREVAKELGLPPEVFKKKVFPGPGFAIRVDGVVTKEKVEVVKKCTEIIENVIFTSEISDKIWMAFGILINVHSLGVQGDKKVKNKYAIVVRVVESNNSLTANFSQNVYPFLEEISSRIIKETNIGRVVYDITNKPPATIEWQ